MASQKNSEHMRSALAIARRGLGRSWPNPSVGCVVLDKDERVVGRARTGDGGRPHAETQALEQAGMMAKGGSVYVSLEPCAHQGKAPPCAESLIAAGVRRVVVACEDPDPRVSGKGIQTLQEAGIEVEIGVLEREALTLNHGFILRVTQDRPLVTMKAATSSDGKIAAAKGERTQISGEQAMRRAHLERSRHDAVLVGIGTVLADDPQLTTHLPGLEHSSIRVVLDSDLRTPEDSQLIMTAARHPLWIFHHSKEEAKISAFEGKGVKLFQVGTNDPADVLKALAGEGITRLLIEGGGQVNTIFLEAGLCDQFLHFKAPKTLGEGGVDALHGHDLASLENKFGLKKAAVAALDEDLLEIYEKEA